MDTEKEFQYRANERAYARAMGWIDAMEAIQEIVLELDAEDDWEHSRWLFDKVWARLRDHPKRPKAPTT